jgi:hypothetical protein
MHLGRIEFNNVLFMDWSFASGCSPPRLSTTQLPSATDRPVLLSDRDFHPTVGAYFQAHPCSRLRGINHPECPSPNIQTAGHEVLGMSIRRAVACSCQGASVWTTKAILPSKRPLNREDCRCGIIQPTCLPDTNRRRVSELKRESRRECINSHRRKLAKAMADGRAWSQSLQKTTQPSHN